MNITPLGNRIVVKLVKKAKTSASGIILATEEKDEQSIGEVISIGKGQGKDNNVQDLALSIGDKVMFGKYSGEEIKDQHDQDTVYKIVEGKDVVAVIK